MNNGLVDSSRIRAKETTPLLRGLKGKTEETLPTHANEPSHGISAPLHYKVKEKCHLLQELYC